MTAPDPFRQAWQALAPSEPPALRDLQRAAGRFERRIRFRNALEYAAAALVVLAFSAFALFMPVPLIAMRIGAVLVVVGTIYVAWQLHRRASVRPLPPAMPLIDHHRAMLVRQRDALASVGRWYLAPLVPGMLLVMFGPLIHAGPAAVARLGWQQLALFALPPAFFLFIWLLNRRAARRLQAMIDNLDTLETKS